MKMGLFAILMMTITMMVLPTSMGVRFVGPRATIMPVSREDGDNIKFSQFKIINGFIDTGKRFFNGMGGLGEQFSTYIKLKKRINSEGDSSLSYTEFKFMQTTVDDFMKCIRIGLMATLSPEFVAYSYLIIPAISSENPWAWMALPSTFDKIDDKIIRDKAVQQRRQLSILHAANKYMENLYSDVIDKNKDKSKIQISRIMKSLSYTDGNFELAMEELKPFYSKNKCTINDLKNVNKRYMALELNKMPWTVVRDLCKSIGVDGVPNIWVLRRLNKGDINRYFNQLRKTDLHITTIGGSTNLEDAEIIDACFERGISITGKRSISEMRKDLDDWLRLVDEFSTLRCSTKPKPNRIIYNEQNVRLALSSLHTAKNLRKSSFAAPIRAVVGAQK